MCLHVSICRTCNGDLGGHQIPSDVSAPLANHLLLGLTLTCATTSRIKLQHLNLWKDKPHLNHSPKPRGKLNCTQ